MTNRFALDPTSDTRSYGIHIYNERWDEKNLQRVYPAAVQHLRDDADRISRSRPVRVSTTRSPGIRDTTDFFFFLIDKFL